MEILNHKTRGTNMMFQRIFIVLFCGVMFPSAQKLTDEGMKEWVSRFSSLNSLMVNDDGSFAAVNKSYLGNPDTLLVFSSYKRMPIDTLVGFNVTKSFLGNHQFFAFGNSKAVLANLKAGLTMNYSSVKDGGVIKDAKQYFIVDHQKLLTVYNEGAKVLVEMDSVQMITGDRQKLLITRRTSEGAYEIICWNGKRAVLLYRGHGVVEKTELMPSGKYLSIRERNASGDKRSLKMIHCVTGRVYAPEELQLIPERTIKVTEINDGESFLVAADSPASVADNPMIDIWYGTDKDLRFRKSNKTVYRFWHLTAVSGNVQELPTDLFEVFAALNSSRYVWAFSNREAYDYVHGSPLYDLYEYDLLEKKSTLIFPESSEITGSENGRYAVSYSRKDKVWKVYDLHNKSFNLIKENGLHSPVFSNDHQNLFFSGKTDLYAYHLPTQSLRSLQVSEDAEVMIVDKVSTVGFSLLKTKFQVSSVEVKRPIRLRLSNADKGLNSIVDFKNGAIKVVVTETDRRIKEVATDLRNRKIFTIEENFNFPDALSMSSPGQQKKVPLYQSNAQDKKVSQLKAESITFKNSLGVPLKALLTYPINYNPAKKYPLIVRIYQKQSSGSSKYITGEIGQDGFSKRLLIEQDYFVYQPDVVFDSRGTGIAALDCVHAAMDAIADYGSIDFAKVGLTGHSMGGYETNFIATHSTRFAAFISGASVSNLSQFYFSYSKIFQMANYSRFENGQFEVDVPFVGNRELYFRNDPINFVQNVAAPMLMWTGLKDSNVPPEQTEAFYMGLLRNRKPVIALFYKDQEHSLGILTKETFDLNRRSIEWWNYFLKGQKEIEWISKEMNDRRKEGRY